MKESVSNVVVKRGTKADLEKETLKDGLLSFTTDDGRIHLDYMDGTELKRKTFYSGKLTIGKIVYDGTEDATVDVYEGEINDNNN